MDFTKLPTDNLYKFLAFTGILVAIISIAAAYGVIGDAVKEQMEIYGGQEIVYIELKCKEAIDKGKGKLSSEERLRLLKNLRDIKIEGEKAGIRLNQFGQLRNRALEIKNYTLISFWLGIALAIAGFLLWYNRLQSYLDTILRQQISGSNSIP